MSFTVAKVGGSLFDLPDFTERLQQWLESQKSRRLLFVAGGGPLVDVVRTMDHLHHLGDERAHWLAIDAMAVSTALLAAIVDGIVVRTIQEAENCWVQNRIVILDPRHFCREDKAGSSMAHCWNVTSDSIAACVAIAWGAARLVLLKSASPPDLLDDWSATGYCDPWFNRMLTGGNLDVSAINLRATPS